MDFDGSTPVWRLTMSRLIPIPGSRIPALYRDHDGDQNDRLISEPRPGHSVEVLGVEFLGVEVLGAGVRPLPFALVKHTVGDGSSHVVQPVQ